jgi:hypothetical protein
MNLIDLEEALEDLLPSGFSIETDRRGQIIIFTALKEDEDGSDLIEFDSDADEDLDSPRHEEDSDED